MTIPDRRFRRVLLLLGLAAWLLPPSGHARVAGGGSARADCYAEFDGVTATSGTRVDCTDGDPTCDADGACGNGCVFMIAVCAFQSDVDGCTPHQITGFPTNTGGLAVPPTPVSAPICAAPTAVAVGLKKNGKRAGKRVIRLVASASEKPTNDKDKLTLRCLPRTDDCPVSGTTTTTVVTSTSVPTSTGPTTSTTTLPCTGGLGPRTFSVAPNGAFFSSGGNDANVSSAGSAMGSLALCAGAPDANGVASLTVNADSIFGLRIIDGSVLCVKVSATGSQGKIDCDGGTPVGALYTVDSHGAGANDAEMLATEQGPPGAPGDAYVLARVRVHNCDSTPDPGDPVCLAPVLTSADCTNPAKINFDAEDGDIRALSTGTTTVQVINPRVGSPGNADVSKTGQPFDCASWVEDGPGILLTGVFGLDAGPSPSVVWDTANAIQIDD